MRQKPNRTGVLKVQISRKVASEAKELAEKSGHTLCWIVEQALSYYIELSSTKPEVR